MPRFGSRAGGIGALAGLPVSGKSRKNRGAGGDPVGHSQRHNPVWLAAQKRVASNGSTRMRVYRNAEPACAFGGAMVGSSAFARFSIVARPIRPAIVARNNPRPEMYDGLSAPVPK